MILLRATGVISSTATPQQLQGLKRQLRSQNTETEKCLAGGIAGMRQWSVDVFLNVSIYGSG